MTVWDETRTERLRTLWAAGWSAAKIAADLGCFRDCSDGGRSAVIGKIHRLKLPPPRARESSGHGGQKFCTSNETATAKASAPQPQAPGSAALTPSSPAAPAWPVRATSDKPAGTGIPFGALSDSNCHWPKGDPGQPDFSFCGRPARPGQPYCAGHCRLAYQPVPARRTISRAY